MAGLCWARCENIIKSFVNERQLKYGHVCEINDGPKSDFQNEAKCKTFLVKMSFICLRIKKKIHINGFACSIPLKKRIEATGKWPIVKSSKPHNYTKIYYGKCFQELYAVQTLASLPADVLWGSFVTHSFLPLSAPWGRNEYVTDEPQRTSAERLYIGKCANVKIEKTAAFP